MRLTPLDIRKQEFKKGMRGLDTDEVYAFLSTVADEYEAIINENKTLRERLVELDTKVQEYRGMEKTLRDTLLTAERITNDARENARRKADLIIREAELEAEKGVRDIRAGASRLREETLALKRQREAYLARMKSLVESHLHFLRTAEKDMDEDDRRIEDEMTRATRRSSEPVRPLSAEPDGARAPRPSNPFVPEADYGGGPARSPRPPVPPLSARPEAAPERRPERSPEHPPERPLERPLERRPDDRPAAEAQAWWDEAAPSSNSTAVGEESPARAALDRMMERHQSIYKEVLNEPARPRPEPSPRPDAGEQDGPVPQEPGYRGDAPPRKRSYVPAGDTTPARSADPIPSPTPGEWSLERLKRDILSRPPREDETD